jgi:hypothetical protein
MLPREGIRKRSPALPLRIPFSGDDRASQVPGEPQCLHALLFDPGGTLALLLSHARMLPSAGSTASASATHLSRLNHTAYRPPVYASQPGLPQKHATLGSGCQHALPGRTVYLQGPTKEFPLPTGGFPSFQALPGASYQMLVRRAGRKRASYDFLLDREVEKDFRSGAKSSHAAFVSSMKRRGH